jgi:hypothetical protein
LAKVIVGMTISLDGFVADQNGKAGRLYPDLAALRHTGRRGDQTGSTSIVSMNTPYCCAVADLVEPFVLRLQRGAGFGIDR